MTKPNILSKEEMKKMPYLIVVDRLSISSNVLLRMHWAERRKLNIEWEWELALATDWRIPDVKEKEKRKVKIISYRKRRLDPDRFVGGLSPLIDALKKRRLIWDDHVKYLDLETEQRLDKNWQRTEILIFLMENKHER